MRLRLWARLVLGALLVGSVGPKTLAQPSLPALAPNSSGRPELLTDPTVAAPPNGRPTMLPDSVPEQPSSGAIVLFGQYDFLRLRRQGNDYAIIDPNLGPVPQGPIQSLEGAPQSGFR